jgi:hypothetical protein
MPEVVARVTVGQATSPLVAITASDDLAVGITGDFRVRDLQ